MSDFTFSFDGRAITAKAGDTIAAALLTKGYGAVIMTNGDNGGALIQRLLRMIQQEHKWDALDQPIPRRYGPL